jgi:hypothetical protein
MATLSLASDLRLTDVLVRSHGFENGGEFCSNFSLTNVQAREFLRRASQITSSDYHQLPELPCYVRGTGQLGGRPVEWEIRAGGTGFVTIGSERPTLIVCRSVCDHMLK